MSAPRDQPPPVPLHLARQLAVGRRTSKRRRRAFAATVGLAAVAATALVACDADQPPSYGLPAVIADPGEAPASAITSTSSTSSTSSPTPITAPPRTTTPDVKPVPGDDPGVGDAVDLDPVGEPAGTAADPCDERETGAALAVTPDPAVLEDGDLSSLLTITNCGDENVDWTAATIPTVALADDGGNLGPGSSSERGFDVDASRTPGAIQFKIKVSEPGVNHYVDGHAFRQTLGGDVVADVGLTAGEGAGGCALQCITTAWLTGNATTPNVDLHIETNTPAVIEMWVSEDEPDLDGAPMASSGDLATEWSTLLSPIDITDLDPAAAVAQTGDELVQSWDTVLSGLAGDTTHHIVVMAIDANGNTALREGTIHTAEAPHILVTFHEVHVVRDGDDSSVNRGELSFRWGLQDLIVGSRGEDKLDDGATVTLDAAHNKYVIQGLAAGFLPGLYVNALERDADGWSEFCSTGDIINTDSGREDDCDMKWNVANSGLITVESLDDLDRCTEFGLPEAYADTPCLRLVSPHVGDDYPEFWAIVSFHRAG